MRKNLLKPSEDLKSLWKQAKARGLTLKKAAGLLEKKWLGKWGVSTVRDAVQGRGKEARENQLRVTLTEFLSGAESANEWRAESVKLPVEINAGKPEYLTSEEWKQRINTAELEAARWRTAFRLFARKQISSKLPDAEQAILDAALDEVLRPPGKS